MGVRAGFKVKYRGAEPSLPKRQTNPVKKTAFVAAGELWHRDFRPRHFTEEGARLYRYKPRSAKYREQKQRRLGHDRPLVWMGESEIQSRLRDIRATSRRGRIFIKAPKLNFRSSPKAPNMREEMTRVAHDEAVEMANTFGETFVEGLERLGGERVVE